MTDSRWDFDEDGTRRRLEPAIELLRSLFPDIDWPRSGDLEMARYALSSPQREEVLAKIAAMRRTVAEQQRSRSARLVVCLLVGLFVFVAVVRQTGAMPPGPSFTLGLVLGYLSATGCKKLLKVDEMIPRQLAELPAGHNLVVLERTLGLIQDALGTPRRAATE